MTRPRRSSTTSSASPTTPWSPPSGWAGGSAARRSSRRTSRWPTSASTSSARPARCWRYAGELEGAGRGEDDLAYLRDERDFRNVKLVERAADRLRRRHGAAAGLRDLAVRAVRRPARQRRRDPRRGRRQGGQGGRLPPRPRRATGCVRLGDGTDESHARMQAALDAEWPYVDELFAPVDAALVEAGVAADPAALRDAVLARRRATCSPRRR